jgi:solute:Na+ symporter, SSS family
VKSEEAILGSWGIAVMASYLVALLALGWMGRQARKEKSLADFYLGGRSLGFFVLLLTLYATQYSGNTLIGFSGSAYRNGFTFLVAVVFMMSVVAMQFLFAPKLHRLSVDHGFITFSDYFFHRYRSRALAVVISITGIIALLNYVLTNLKAIGTVAEVATGGKVTFAQGVIFLSVIILIYETLGGLRSVAWTDVLQGVILMIGCGVIFFVILFTYDGAFGVFGALQEKRPDLWEPLTAAQYKTWLSTLLVVTGGIAIYPHAIQRIYAATDSRTLKRAYQVMLFMPLFTTLLMIFVGWVGAAQIPGLDRVASEGITLRMLGELTQQYPSMQIVVVLFLAAVFAAIMSTVDSALLSISSMIIQDLYRPVNPSVSEEQLTKIGKRISWVMMALMVPLAIKLPQTIWWFIQIKVELLVQALPALLLGLHWRPVKSGPALWGFVAGTVLTLVLVVGSNLTEAVVAKPLGFHGGLWALLLNLMIVGVGSVGIRSEKNE